MTGVALYDGLTIRAGILEDSWWADIWEADTVLIEKPRIYRTHPRPQDLLTLALTAGELAGKYSAKGHGSCSYIFPSDWKRQLDKEICWNRVLAKMTPAELASIANLQDLAKTKRHNACDAIGIAFFAANKRVF